MDGVDRAFPTRIEASPRGAGRIAMTRCVLSLFAAFFLVLAQAAPSVAQDDRPILVFAAASLTNALDEVVAGWTAPSGAKVRVSYAGSSALARQIEQGAPADLFISADTAWMDYVGERRLVADGSRLDLLGNRIALIAPADSARGPVEVGPGLDIPALLGADGRMAMADVAAVPAGRYGKAGLERLGLWQAVSGRVAQTENVRVALALVSRGEAPLGIVYTTDAAADPGVKVLGTFPQDSHPPVVYPAAVLAGSTHPDARALLRHLSGDAARAIFEKAGFTVLAPPPAG